MRKLISAVVLPVAAIMLYKWRYKLLNLVLGNDSIRRMSVRAAMGMPGIRSRLLSRAFRS